MISKKPVITNLPVNKCKCGNKITLKRCVWIDEAEKFHDLFSLSSITLKKYILRPKINRRKFWLGVCNKCEILFYHKP